MTGWLAAGALFVLLLPIIVMAAALGGLGAGAGPGVIAGVPPVVLDAYVTAAESTTGGGCRLPWPVLAGIGKVESGHAAGAQILPDGAVAPWIIGPRLDGTAGTAAIADSDDGRWDRDPTWDRAAGPMQFLPGSWRRFGRDGNHDGLASPHNVYDAALAAAAHLCRAPAPPAGGKDLSDPAQLRGALFAYNRSAAYVREVLAWIEDYAALAQPRAAVVGGAYALPVAREQVTAGLLAASHHDYPAWDLPVPVGTTVSAAHGGRVAAVTSVGSRCGLGVVIAGADGYSYTYCHASAVHVMPGATVAAGQPLLRSGNSGNSTGPHLHLGIRRPDGRSVCPQPLLAAWHAGIPAHPATAPTSGCTH